MHKAIAIKLGFLLLLSCCVSLSQAQNVPEEGGNEVEVWAGGGHSVAGGTRNTGMFNGGLRYGWILTDLHGPGFLRGNFEYAVDAVPVFLVLQPRSTAYGFGLNPVNMKWNFAPRGRIVPYFELGGGTLFSTVDVPSGVSRVNFTSGAALGFHRAGDRAAWSLEARFMHISNAGLAARNPGMNTVQVRIGIGIFRRR